MPRIDFKSSVNPARDSNTKCFEYFLIEAHYPLQSHRVNSWTVDTSLTGLSAIAVHIQLIFLSNVQLLNIKRECESFDFKL